MAKADEMRALIARVEAAEGADFQLDWLITDYLGWPHGKGTPPWAYTASLDAAVSLVPEGFGWEVGANGSYGIHGHVDCGKGGIGSSGLATPALALVHAALRARLAMEEQA